MSPLNANIPIVEFNGMPDSETMAVIRSRALV